MSLSGQEEEKEEGRIEESWGGGTQNTLWGVEVYMPPSVPISCELPQMKGRNWKSSRPHTPWLPAGSILYVFWSFRITSRYLHRRMGKRGDIAEVKGQSPPFCHWELTEARNNHLRV